MKYNIYWSDRTCPICMGNMENEETDIFYCEDCSAEFHRMSVDRSRQEYELEFQHFAETLIVIERLQELSVKEEHGR